MSHDRRNHYDVTNTVRISHPAEVCAAVTRILHGLYPQVDTAPVEKAFDTFTRLYAGALPGYVGCDTWYHDAQHSLDCALAMARLLDGHERKAITGSWLGARRGMLGIIIALFHDAGYIRKTTDTVPNGAAYTLSHVRRSGEFLAGFLPQVGYADAVELTCHVVHFTGYEVELDHIGVSHPLDRMLGFLLGTADLLAQSSDRCYLEKCRDFLYREFEICGLAGEARPGGPKPIYRSPRDLLEKTPEYQGKLWAERLDGYFQKSYRYMDAHFGGRNPYVEEIRAHLNHVARLIRGRRLGELRRRPRVVGAAQMRQRLKRSGRAQPRAAGRPAAPI